MDDKPTDCEVDECVLTGDSSQRLVIATTKTKICISYKWMTCNDFALVCV